ncbi:hypothetical protein [Romboutsia sp. 13368]|uniref:hypothetical protein n=1 Tax=Romboutsia sp. 13368 TaxID=2708053 RepID=UPI0025CEEF02|nr:hypothetical protein [Romboutsia sp. 13368]
MKIFKNRLVLWIVSIAIFILTIFSYSKIKEYIVLKDVFVFSKDSIVSIWRVKKGEDTHDYNYNISSSDANYLSNILRNSQLKNATVKDSPPSNLGKMTIFLDGRIREEDGGVSVEFKRGITLVPIDNDSVYVFLDINKLRNDDSFNMNGVMQRSYIIDSKELLEFINENT